MTTEMERIKDDEVTVAVTDTVAVEPDDAPPAAYRVKSRPENSPKPSYRRSSSGQHFLGSGIS